MLSTKLYFSIVVIILITILVGGAGYIGERRSILGVFFKSSSIDPQSVPEKFKYLEHKKELLKYENQTNNMYLDNAKYVKVLIYHGITENDDSENLSWDKFRDQMFLLKENGYQTVKLSQFNEYLKGNATLPDKSFLLTFDDGRKDSYYPVQPILEALNYNAVMFLITSRTSNSESFHLTSNEIKEMLNSGRWELGSHSQNGHGFIETDSMGNQGHYLSNKMWIDSTEDVENDNEFALRIEKDLSSAKKDIIEKFGVYPMAFAVPYGDFGQEKTNYTKSKNVILNTTKYIYPLIFIQTWDLEDTENYPLLNSFIVKRISVGSNWMPDFLLQTMERK